eukprot:CAMPEP_0113955584 /NCGR_PEP_ID=MMETSP0011_2-20120614/1442_1 /TAXON_ID=101924 /ORGANISM="Rhodosorus marinus" /LENGTH=64 /DNA_ID=CAMNT_0000965345 /DNA_START=224 /DNA_END=418 /DNA_ORIENTATION=- /assembly_acc=CAM_ASM_000156
MAYVTDGGMKNEGTEQPKKKKICCVCPETRTKRDECMVEHGEEACYMFIEAHKNCLRKEGFDVK